MNNITEFHNAEKILIVGAGPTGLFLGHLLYRAGIPFHIIEKETFSHTHSRAIGIHPVSLDLFRENDLLPPFLEKGVKIDQGAAYLERTRIGKIDFSLTSHQFPFILSIPQHITENILRDRLLALQPDCISYGTELHSFQTHNKGITAFLQPTKENSNEDSFYRRDTPFLIGCDGRNSRVREQSGIAWEGKSYPDTYVMGDFRGQPDTDVPASIFLHSCGVIESFSMPERQQRWVVKTPHSTNTPTSTLLKREVYRRVGEDLSDATCLRSSAFGIERYRARSFNRNRCILAGDAAHIVNPIGGQGMNLGWLGVQTLANCLDNIYRGSNRVNQLESYNKIQQLRERKAAHRAAFNMKLGRSFRWKTPRKVLLHVLLNTPLNHLTARAFTMHGLDRWPV